MERAYTVAEIDALRRACEDRLTFGSTYWPPGAIFRSGTPPAAETLEARVRTYMLAGIVAEDIYEQDKPNEPVNEWGAAPVDQDTSTPEAK